MEQVLCNIQRMRGIDKMQHVSSLIEIESTPGAGHSCEVCGLSFATAEGLSMHVKHRHAQVHSDSGIPFNRGEHALHGVPICRLCRGRMHDWSSLRKHVASGTCSRLKWRVATGATIEELWDAVLRQEQEDPLEPPPGLEADSFGEVGALLSQPISEVIMAPQQMTALRQACSLCGQRLIDMRRIKTHWQKTHSGAWQSVKGEVLGDMASLCSTIRKTCQYCGSSASDVEAHSRQCAVLFQLLAARSLHRQGRLEEAKAQSAGKIRRQDKNKPAYADYSVESSPIGKALGLSRPDKNGEKANARVAELSVGCSLRASRLASLGTGHTMGELLWTTRLVLINPGNHCYANSSILAMPLIAHLRLRAQFGLRIALHTQPEVLAISGWWRYNSEQQDASEYVGVLLSSTASFATVWCSRLEIGGLVETTDHGQALLLEMPTRGTELQSLIDEWQHQAHVHALSSQQEIVPVQIGRCCGGRKNQARLLFSDDISLPIFSQGVRCVHTFYRPVAAVIHIGRDCRSGHYRSLLRSGDEWFYTDDGRQAERCVLEREHQGNVCYIWLVRTRLLRVHAQ